MKKRIFSMLLAVFLLVGMLPVQVFATEAESAPALGCATEGCTFDADHEGNCSNYVAPAACEMEGCTFEAGHEGNCSNYVAPTEACATEGCTYGAGHEGSCSNYVAPTEACATEGCTYGDDHEGNCSNYVAPTDCETEGCTYAYGHEGDCNNAVAPVEEVEPVAVTVSFAAQEKGEFLAPPQLKMQVSSDTAENYGYNDQTDQATQVSAIDVLVAAHVAKYGEAFAKNTATTYLGVSGNFITKMFSIGNGGNICLLVNGKQPGSNGVEQATVSNGDRVELFVYQDLEGDWQAGTIYTDKYVWLELPDGTKVDGQSVYGGKPVTVVAKGYSPFYYGYEDSEDETEIADATIYMVDIAAGKLNSLGVTTGEDGTASITVPESYVGKTVYLTAKGTEMAMTLAGVTIEQAPASETCNLTALEIGIGTSSGTEPTQKLTFSTEFNKDTTSYAVPVVDYIGSWSNRVAYIKATAADPNATITASLNGTSTSVPAESASWAKLVQAYVTGYVYGSPLNAAAKNELKITVEVNGETKTYTVIIPIQADIANSAVTWKTDLVDGIYYLQNAEASLSVEAQYKNRPLDNEDVITYQWYSNTTDSTENGTAIEGATGTTYVPSTAELGTTYYYVVASCAELTPATSNIIAVTVTDKAAPTSITLVSDHPYTIEDTWVKALGGVKYVATIGDTMNIKALDQDGKETPVAWTVQAYGGSFDTATGEYTFTSGGYTYLTATSLYDSSITSGEKVIQLADYKFSTANKNKSVALSTDGQTVKTTSVNGGIAEHTNWSLTIPEGVAECTTDLTKKGNSVSFNLLRPGTVNLSFELDLGGENDPKLTDTATVTITGVAVEDAEGTQGKTYLEITPENTAPTAQLTAYVAEGRTVTGWSSADETIAAVDENGLVTAKGIGSVIISATDSEGIKGGIKVVVSDASNPTFENIAFQTGNAWTAGVKRNISFLPTTYSYTLECASYSTSSLTMTAATLYNTDKLTAVASYTGIDGTAQSVAINSGAATVLPNIPFGSSTITVTLTDKADAEISATYTFEVTRPRDTYKQIANSTGIVMKDAEGSSLSSALYNERAEGYLFRTDETGTVNSTYTVSYNYYNYRTFLLGGRESFTMQVKGYTNYVHLRYSTDDGVTWTELPQGGGATGVITFPAREDTNAVVKVILQAVSDSVYVENGNAFPETVTHNTNGCVYTIWAEQIPPASEAKICSASTDSGDWYPAFDAETTSYNISVPNGSAAPVLTYTVSEGATVTVGDVAQTPNEDGSYTLTLTNASQSISITGADGVANRQYSIRYSERALGAPDKVVDYLSVNSQYTNGGAYGMYPESTLTGGSALLSLGNFGGYVTYYYANGLTDNPNHQYGVDFYIDGNAFKDTSTGTGRGSMEPGQVWVSENGSTWYALAGSEHYEPSTVWNYSVTYTKTETGGTSWSDNYGNTDAVHGRSFAWPNPEIYTLNNLAAQDSFALTGILIPCVDGTITGTDNFNSLSKGGRFGYVDMLANGTSNPYLDNSDYSNASSGFDLAWAVDGAGNPVDVSGKSFHYVKVVTASNLMAGAANEKSTEVGGVVCATTQSNAVGITTAPSGVTISDDSASKTISFIDGQQIYEQDLGDMEYVSILVNGTTESDNIYVNNQRVASGTAATGIKISKDQKLVRIIVQNGEKEPVIYLLKLSRSTESQDLIDNVKITASGAGRLAETTDGKVYTAEVGYRVDSIGITANVVSGAEVTIDDKALEDAYELEEGENTFTITATKDGLTQTVTLKVTREKAPESTGKITVYFTLLGDGKHGSGGTAHTLADGNLTTWISKTAYEMDTPAAVVDLIELALKGQYSFVNSGGNYVSSVNGLAEFDNGPNSGWMYTINGYHSQQGIAEQQLKDGDTIVLHYSDDWTKEHGEGGDDDAKAIENVEKLIDAIGTVTLNSADEIEAARKAYDNLTYAQKQLVDNYATLTAAEAKYADLKEADDEKKADAVEDLIDSIEVSTNFEDDVKAAQKAYNALTADQKKLVDNYSKLANALKELADEEDKEAAEAVEKLIENLGTITLESEEDIKAAREAYDKLTDEQKALVENLTDLEAAEEKLAVLKADAVTEDIYKTTGDYIEDLGTPVPGSVGGEWMVIGLIRSGREIDTDTYYEAAVKYVQENIDENERLHRAKSSENSRIILALTAMGKDVTNVDGHNLLNGLNDMAFIQKQGINGPIWALIAFDSGNYPTPEGDVTREALIQVILDAQLADGGWALSGETSDADMTGMAVQALAPYYESNADVKKALDEAIQTLSKMQAADGSYGSIDGTSSESVAQVIVALAALGIDADKDTRFIKNGISAVDALCAFHVEGGGFRHLMDGALDGMATEQGYYALTAYFRMLDGENALYNMTDVVDLGGDVEVVEPAETLPAETESAETELAPTDEGEGGFPWWIIIVVLVAGVVIAILIPATKKRRR